MTTIKAQVRVEQAVIGRRVRLGAWQPLPDGTERPVDYGRIMTVGTHIHTGDPGSGAPNTVVCECVECD